MDNLDLTNMMNMKWTDIQKAAGSGCAVLLPAGVIEEHGPHLCLGTDIYTAEVYCAYIRKVLKKRGVESITAPPFYWGLCQSTRGFIGIRKETARSLLVDILSSLKNFGFSEIYGINAHGDIDQNIVLIEAFREAAEVLHIRGGYLFREELMSHYGISGNESHICPIKPQTEKYNRTEVPDVHAGDLETATISRFYPGFADTAAAEKLPPVRLADDRIMDWILGGRTEKLSPDGYLGDPASYGSVDIIGHIEDLSERMAESILVKRKKSE